MEQNEAIRAIVSSWSSWKAGVIPAEDAQSMIQAAWPHLSADEAHRLADTYFGPFND